MNKRTVWTLWLGIFVGLASIVLPNSANAQQGQLRYQTRYSKAQVGNIINKLENSSDAFSRDFRKAMNSGRRDGTYNEDNFNRIVEDYENSVDRLRRE
jgi:hypothetical protein